MVSLKSKLISILFIISSVFLFSALLNTKEALAFDCSHLKNTPVDPQWVLNSGNWKYTGKSCNNPGNYGKNTRCVSSSGYDYYATYCIGGAALNLPGEGCEAEYPVPGSPNDPNVPETCRRPQQPPSLIGNIFGKIIPPQSIQKLGFGATGISKFLSNGVVLIYSIAAIVLIFMLLWGAFDWMVSGGDKEKLAGAQRKIINAIIGILLFAAAFAIIQVLGTFTGFPFFTGQK